MSSPLCVFGNKTCQYKCPAYRAENEYSYRENQFEHNKSHCWIVDGFKVIVDNREGIGDFFGQFID